MTTPAQAAGITGAQAVWKLQYAERGKSSITEVAPKDLASFSKAPWFVTSDDGTGATMTAPVDGPTTSGSHYTRCEGREMTLDGKPAAWDSRTGAHRLMLWLRLDSLMIGGKVSLIQLHDEADDQIQILAERGTSGYRLYWSVGKGKGKGGDLATIDSEFRAGVWIPAMLEVVPGRTNFYYGPDWSVPRVSTKTMRQSAKSYAKWGPYCQVKTPKGANITASFRGVVITHDATVTATPSAPGTPVPDPVPPPTGQTLGVGGIATPAGAILATADTTAPLTITQAGVYDGAGHKVGRVTVKASGVVVQNYRIVAGGQYGAVLDADDVTLQNCDITGVRPSGDGDLNAITFFGNRIKILCNTAVDFVVGDPGGSHTDAIQTWVSSSHPTASSDIEIRGNRFVGPANPSRDSKIPSIHQCLMAEDYGRGGNSGGSSSGMRNWLIADNYFGDSWNQCLKLAGVDDVTITRNVFAGSSDKVIEVDDGSNVVLYSDNVVGAGYGSVGVPVTTGPGQPIPGPFPTPGTSRPKRVVIVLRHGEKPSDPNDHTLNAAGQQRAAALADLFLRDQLPAGLWHPDRLIASKGNTLSERPRQTVQPLADRGHLPLNLRYDAEKDYKVLGPWLAQRLDVTMVCLEHTAIINTCRGLGTISPAMPKSWPSDRFDVFWVFTSDDGKVWTFTQVPQLLLPGDRPTTL